MKTDKATTSHPPLATLHLLFDGLAVDAAAARHARDCPSCAHQLQGLADQRQALGHLLHRDADWVRAAHRQGRAVLADLLAELARACLARREAARGYATRSTTPLSELPRPIESITVDIRTLVTRLKGLAASTAATAASAARAASPATAATWTALERLAERRANDPELLGLAVEALRALEGASPRSRTLAEAAR